MGAPSADERDELAPFHCPMPPSGARTRSPQAAIRPCPAYPHRDLLRRPSYGSRRDQCAAIASFQVPTGRTKAAFGPSRPCYRSLKCVFWSSPWAARLTAGASEFFILSQSGERPER
jgi:hypothetical protein